MSDLVVIAGIDDGTTASPPPPPPLPQQPQPPPSAVTAVVGEESEIWQQLKLLSQDNTSLRYDMQLLTDRVARLEAQSAAALPAPTTPTEQVAEVHADDDSPQAAIV